MSNSHTGNVQPSIDLEEHRSKNLQAKAVVLHGYIPGSDEYVPITAVDNGDGTYSASSTGGSAASSIATASYYYIQKDTEGATYKYYGYMKDDGGWYIKRITIATNLAEFVKGTSGYTSEWTNRASQTYADYAATF